MSTGDTIWDQLKYIENRAAQKQDIYEEAIAIGAALKPNDNARSIVMGRLTMTLDTVYGDATIKKFAKDTGFKYKTLYKWSQTVKFWTPEALVDYLLVNKEPILSFTHFHHAMGIGDIQSAWKIIHEWEGLTLSCAAAYIDMKRRKGEPLPPITLMDNAPVRITDVDLAHGWIKVFVGDYVGELANHTGKALTMTIKESEMKA